MPVSATRARTIRLVPHIGRAPQAASKRKPGGRFSSAGMRDLLRRTLNLHEQKLAVPDQADARHVPLLADAGFQRR